MELRQLETVLPSSKQNQSHRRCQKKFLYLNNLVTFQFLKMLLKASFSDASNVIDEKVFQKDLDRTSNGMG